MCKFKFRFLIGLLTFGIGISGVFFWLVKFSSPQYLEEATEPNKTNVIETVIADNKLESYSEEYFQIGENEKRIGIYHKVRPHSDNSSLNRQLSEFAELFGKSRKNTFYISKIETDNNKDFWVSVYWKEDKSILILYPPFDKEDELYYNYFYAKRIDLVWDVVPTEKEVGTTNYLVSKTWAKEMISKCISSGNKVTIEKRK